MQDNKHAYALNHWVHTEWQLPISGVHSIMMEKSALAGEGGGARPPPFTLLPSHTRLQCTRGQIHSPYFFSTLYALCALNTENNRGQRKSASVYLWQRRKSTTLWICQSNSWFSKTNHPLKWKVQITTLLLFHTLYPWMVIKLRNNCLHHFSHRKTLWLIENCMYTIYGNVP